MRISDWSSDVCSSDLTRDLAEKAWAHIQEVEGYGGMAKAIEAGIPKMRIEEAAARTQARIDAGRQTIVGVNTYRVADPDTTGSAAARERVCEYGSIPVGAGSLKKNKT